MAQADLQMIQKKVRKLTKSFSEAQLSTTELNEYINTFLLYDFPMANKLLNLKETFSFYTQAYVDTYTTSDDPTNPLYDFKNRVTDVLEPFFVAGNPVTYFQDQASFYAVWPKGQTIQNLSGQSGDGATVTFTGTFAILQQANSVNPQAQLIPNKVVFTSKTTDLVSMTLVDYPVSNTVGALGLPDEPQSLPSPYGQVNYVTGAYTITFPNPPGAQQPIVAEYNITYPSRPYSILYFDGSFTLRPIPDKSYRVEFDVYVQPTELITSADTPKLKEWWQYIAIGAAKKIYEDRVDMESAEKMGVLLQEQESLIQTRTHFQLTTRRAKTIYDSSIAPNAFISGWNAGNNINQ